jgi:hypothetical protein
MKNKALIIIFLTLFFLVGCSPAESNAAEPVEAYLQAIVEQDADRISTLVCSDWVGSALLELDAFMGVAAELENVSCDVLDSSDDNAVVACSGSIVATYNNEQQQFSLEGREYLVVREGDEWVVCGYR